MLPTGFAEDLPQMPAAEGSAGVLDRTRVAPESRTFVLIHGAWHGGWCYSRVAALLRAQGHTVYTPTLTGLADTAHLLNDAVDLDTHIADIVNLIDWYDLEDVILCGHSYGGLPVIGAADRRSDSVAALVLLDAFVLDDGESLAGISRQPMPTTPTQAPFPASAFVQTEADRPWVESKLTPQPNGTRSQKITLSGAWLGIVNKTYIRMPEFNNPMFDAALARFADDPAWTTQFLLGSGHDAMIDQPAKLAAMLQATAREVLARTIDR